MAAFVPFVEKKDPILAIRLNLGPLALMNARAVERFGAAGKPFGDGDFLMVNLRTGRQWILSPPEFVDSGWGPVDDGDDARSYFFAVVSTAAGL